jgi:hypothetical protein
MNKLSKAIEEKTNFFSFYFSFKHYVIVCAKDEAKEMQDERSLA